MNIRLLVCDFDNTLYDWVSYFVVSFYRMVDEAVAILDVDREQLLDDFRAVHQRFRDSEHPFALLETDSVKERYPGLDRDLVAERLDSAFYAFNRARKETLQLYPGVMDTLRTLRAHNVRLVGHTEAKYLAVTDRLKRLQLGSLFSRVYCRERSPSSRPASRSGWESNRDTETEIVQLSHHQAKPSGEVLTEICGREGFELSEVAYVGDSLFKDMLMANRVGVHAIWAKYGTVAYHGNYESLVRVSHWRDEDIDFERQLRSESNEIRPDFILENRFDELLWDQALDLAPRWAAG